MFDSISVSQRTRKPWTVTVSFAGQLVMTGLAVLVPLVSNEAVPHIRILSEFLPEPPAGPPVHRPQTVAKPARPIPFQLREGALSAPARVPDRIPVIEDPNYDPAASDVPGVIGGTRNQTGPGNSVIAALARSMPVPEPPPPVAAKPAAPATIPRIRVGGAVQEGKLISGPPPVYPPLARAAGIQGTVRLQAVISRDGAIMDLRVMSGNPLLVPSAMAAVKQWLFRPTYLNGDPVEVATDIEINFTLRH